MLHLSYFLLGFSTHTDGLRTICKLFNIYFFTTGVVVVDGIIEVQLGPDEGSSAPHLCQRTPRDEYKQKSPMKSAVIDLRSEEEKENVGKKCRASLKENVHLLKKQSSILFSRNKKLERVTDAERTGQQRLLATIKPKLASHAVTCVYTNIINDTPEVVITDDVRQLPAKKTDQYIRRLNFDDHAKLNASVKFEHGQSPNMHAPIYQKHRNAVYGKVKQTKHCRKAVIKLTGSNSTRWAADSEAPQLSKTNRRDSETPQLSKTIRRIKTKYKRHPFPLGKRHKISDRALRSMAGIKCHPKLVLKRLSPNINLADCSNEEKWIVEQDTVDHCKMKFIRYLSRRDIKTALLQLEISTHSKQLNTSSSGHSTESHTEVAANLGESLPSKRLHRHSKPKTIATAVETRNDGQTKHGESQTSKRLRHHNKSEAFVTCNHAQTNDREAPTSKRLHRHSKHKTMATAAETSNNAQINHRETSTSKVLYRNIKPSTTATATTITTVNYPVHSGSFKDSGTDHSDTATHRDAETNTPHYRHASTNTDTESLYGDKLTTGTHIQKCGNNRSLSNDSGISCSSVLDQRVDEEFYGGLGSFLLPHWPYCVFE